MTTEEKARAYDKAIEIAKKELKQDLHESGVWAIQRIFPQLRESEDERIRKFLLDYAIEMIAGLESDISLSTYDGIKGHDPDAEAELTQWQKARAYLEKQKEQKPAEWSEEDENALIYLHELIGFGFTEKFCDAQTASDMRMWLNTRLKSLRPSWKPSEEDEEPLSTF